MKIAIAVQPWDRVASKVGEGSAVAIIAYNLAQRLAGDHEVTIFANQGAGQAKQETDSQGVRFQRIKVFSKPFFQLADRLTGFWNMSPPLLASSWYYRSYALQVAKMAREQKVEILHLNTFFQHASIARKYNPDARIVLHMHAEIMSLLPRELVRPHLENIDCFIAVSDFVGNRFKARFPEHADKCITVHNGVDPDRFYPLPPAAPESPPRRILYVGRVSPEKGIHVLLSAFESVIEKHPDCQLDIVGAPGLLPYSYYLGLTSDLPALGLKKFYGVSLLEKIRYQILQKDTGYLNLLRRMIGSGVAQRIHFHGAVPNEELLKLYNSSSMLVFPSVCHEPFGMPITEAMACGLPVVSTDSGGVPELIQDGQTGLLVKRDDAQSLSSAIIRLLDDEILAEKLGQSARNNVLSSITFDHAAKRLISCYERLLSS